MTTKEERNARARDNQRLSRARRMDYIATLEEKIRHYEKDGIAATQQMQASARLVEKQNTLLKAWVCRLLHLSEHELQEWLKMPSDMAEASFDAALSSSEHQIRPAQGRMSYSKSPADTHLPLQGMAPMYTANPPITDAQYPPQRKIDAPHNIQFSQKAPFGHNLLQAPSRRSTGSWTEPRYDVRSSLPYSTFPRSRRHSGSDEHYHFDSIDYTSLPDPFAAQMASPYAEPSVLASRSMVNSSQYSLPLESSFHATQRDSFPQEPYSVSYQQQQQLQQIEHQQQRQQPRKHSHEFS